jgi:NAD(P)-dependent dehydrogenase (short-subunit alcohol dehydrogenase family)
MQKTVVITGTTSGIGKALVKAFLSDDVLIFAGYRNRKLLDFDDEKIVPFYIDLKNSTSIKNAAEFIISRVEKVDLLINVAGAVVAGPIEKIEIEKLREQFEVNTFSHIDFTQKLCPVLDNGRVVNVSSMSSFGHFPFISPYCASKRALDIFFNAFAIENHRNIKVISIKPGVISTPIWQKSVSVNEKLLNDCVGYEKEMEFMKTNALKNTQKGLEVSEVANFIKKVSGLKNPKTSYTLGKDAKFAHLLSYLPQDVINSLVKFGLKSRVSAHDKM